MQVAGKGGVPANTQAVVVNVTAVSPTANGLLTVYPDGSTQPGTSSLNYTAGQTLANEVIVPVVDDTVEIHESGRGSANVLADLAGYYGSVFDQVGYGSGSEQG